MVRHDFHGLKQGALPGETNWHVFQIPCEMRPDYKKRETSENEAIVLGFGATVQPNFGVSHLDKIDNTVRKNMQSE